MVEFAPNLFTQSPQPLVPLTKYQMPSFAASFCRDWRMDVLLEVGILLDKIFKAHYVPQECEFQFTYRAVLLFGNY